jgi:hypothetical protein
MGGPIATVLETLAAAVDRWLLCWRFLFLVCAVWRERIVEFGLLMLE